MNNTNIETAPNPQTWKKVIIFRCARPRVVKQIISSLKMQGMEPESVTILEPQNTPREELVKLFGPCNPIYLSPGPFKLWRISPLMLLRLRALGADAFIVPYNNRGKIGYHHIELLGLLSKSSDVVGVCGVEPPERIRRSTVFRPKTTELFSVALPFMQRHPHLFYWLFPRLLYPRMLGIDITMTCNLRCNFCAKTEFNGPHLQVKNLYKIANGIRYADTISIGGGGEATISPHFEEALRIIYEINPKQNLIQIITNGTSLTEKMAIILAGRLNKLIISINAATEESYKENMKGSLKVTKAHIKRFMKALPVADRHKVQTVFAVGAHNYHEIPGFVRQAKELGISNVSLNQFQIIKPDQVSMGLFNIKKEWNDKLDEAIQVGTELGISVYGRKFFEEHPPGPEACPYPETEMLILVNGDVTPCCYTGNNVLGNVYKQSLESIWFGKELLRLRRERHLPQCKECVPTLTYDDYQTHFFSTFKETDEYRQVERDIIESNEHIPEKTTIVDI